MRFFFERNRREAPNFFEGFGVFCSIFRFLKDFSFFFEVFSKTKKTTLVEHQRGFLGHHQVR